ncbi:hypothetical protein [Nocardia sp. NRRL S-836]|uniref:hypothetical protein n=1 Tax=Nocardia sp. NRRL S-836 TaxID=1519492 RepID=UPI0006ADD0E0|nr:hypothetical protein [Nocardia sp. NRRL S-836]KOV80021.1 hypothetical protein ADL03_33935 [Nocardia sp. NRRL S-836]
MSDRPAFELILSLSESHGDDDAVLAIYDFDRPTHVGDSALAYFSICSGPGTRDRSAGSLAA